MIVDIEKEFSLDSEIFWVERKGRVWEFHDPIRESYFLIYSNRLAVRLNLNRFITPPHSSCVFSPNDQVSSHKEFLLSSLP